MNARMILGHAACASLATIVWEVGVNLPAGNPGVAVQAVGVAPFLVAGISLLVARDALRRSLPVQPAVRQRLPQPARKELAR